MSDQIDYDDDLLNKPVTRGELYLIAQQLHVLILQARIEANSPKSLGLLPNEATQDFHRSEKRLDALLDALLTPDSSR